MLGEKNIEDIQVGDKVLTHLCHYMPVTETMNRFPDELMDLHTSSYHVRITPNHPILQWDMFNGIYTWVEAGNLSDGDMICTANGYEFIVAVQECEPEQVYNIAVQEDESYIANGIVVHNCRSGLVPLTDDEYQPDMEFENRNFDTVLDNPEDVSRAFKNIDKFNEKYRVSKFVLDKDLSVRFMFEKGISVGIEGVLPEVNVAKVVPENVDYDGVTYKLTPSDLKKIKIEVDDIPRLLEEWDKENKEKLGKKWGLKKRDYAANLLTSTKSYRLGLGQGHLDRINGIPYLEKGDDKGFNMGYFTGWNDKPSSWLPDAKKLNPNFANLK
jgi:hypothetical protein